MLSAKDCNKYQLDFRRLAYVWVWVLNVLTIRKPDAFNLELTCLCLSWIPRQNNFQHVVLPQIDQMFFLFFKKNQPLSVLSCSSASWQLNVAPCCFYPLLVHVHFLSCPDWAMHGSLLILNLKHVMNWLLICPTDTMSLKKWKKCALFLWLVRIVKKKNKANALWIDYKIWYKNKNKSLPPPPTFVCLVSFEECLAQHVCRQQPTLVAEPNVAIETLMLHNPTQYNLAVQKQLKFISLLIKHTK